MSDVKIRKINNDKSNLLSQINQLSNEVNNLQNKNNTLEIEKEKLSLDVVLKNNQI